MHLYHFNEMFILALVALSIVGVICLGLLTVLAIFVLGRKREKVQQGNNPSNTINPPPALTTDQLLDKLNNFEKNQQKNSALTNTSFGLAVTVFGASNIALFTEFYMKMICAFIALIGLGWFLINITRWGRLRKQ